MVQLQSTGQRVCAFTGLSGSSESFQWLDVLMEPDPVRTLRRVVSPEELLRLNPECDFLLWWRRASRGRCCISLQTDGTDPPSCRWSSPPADLYKCKQDIKLFLFLFISACSSYSCCTALIKSSCFNTNMDVSVTSIRFKLNYKDKK